MGRNRAGKAPKGVPTDARYEDLNVEQDLTPPDVSSKEQIMAKPKLGPTVRKSRMDREVRAAFESVVALSTRPKKKSKKPFPATALQKRMQSGDI
jgi:hypothetical protein